MKTKIKVGDEIYWAWMGRVVAGTVKEIFYESVTKEIKGKLIKRKGSPENPAMLVQSEAGNLALKLQSELQAGSEKKAGVVKPRMFGR